MSDLVSGHYPVKNPEWLLQEQAGAVGGGQQPRTNMGRLQIAADLAAALTSGVATAVAVPLVAGDIVTNLSFRSGATAAGTPTHLVFALYDPNGNLLAQSADQGAAAWAADTTKTLALATQTQIATPAVYYAAIFAAATTVPSLVGVTLPRAAVATGVLATDLPLVRTFGTGLTTAAPSTISGAAASVSVPWVAVS